MFAAPFHTETSAIVPPFSCATSPLQPYSHESPPEPCAKCSVHIAPQGAAVVDSGGHVWHARCFVCHFCGLIVGADCLVDGNRLYHPQCLDLRGNHCHSCKEFLPMDSDGLLQFVDCLWHQKCFKCGLCHALLDEEAVFHSGTAHHPECAPPPVVERGFLWPDGSVDIRPMTRVEPSKLMTLSVYPAVHVLPAFLSLDECHHMQRLAKSLLMERSQMGVSLGQSSAGIIGDARTSSSAFIPKGFDAMVAAIEARAAHHRQIPLSHVGRFHVGHYSPSQEFKVHWDALSLAEALEKTGGYTRTHTILVYLNTPVDHSGDESIAKPNGAGIRKSRVCPSLANGHTQFPLLGMSVKPEAGFAIDFQNVDLDTMERIPEAVHSGAPVCCGEKWVLNIWFYNKPLHNGIVPVFA